jgi:Zn-dependent protease with chaperone function
VNEDKATRYHRLKRQASLLSLGWSVALLGGLIATGATLAIRGRAESLAAGWPASGSVVVVLYVTAVVCLHEIGGFPLAFFSGFLLERRYGLSTERFGAWARDHAKAFGLGLVLSWAGAVLLYLCMRWQPARWWLVAGGLFALIVVAMASLAPVLLLPLFYRVKPLEHASLRARLLGLADRAGARVLGVYEWGLSDKTRKANAALAGWGSTRRILVSDTMLAEYSEDEIEVVLAHELAHHVHGDIWKGILFEAGLIVAGFYLAARVLEAGAARVGLTGVADVAGLPLLLLAAGIVSLVMVPIAHAMSRAFERGADRFALGLTQNPQAFSSAMRRLAAQNLAEENPSRLVQWLFYSHPPIRERIALARAFRS